MDAVHIHRYVISGIMPIIKVNNIVEETVEQELDKTVQMKEYQYIYIVNIVLVITIGGFGNLFTIISICICRIRYVLNNESNGPFIVHYLLQT